MKELNVNVPWSSYVPKSLQPPHTVPDTYLTVPYSSGLLFLHQRFKGSSHEIKSRNPLFIRSTFLTDPKFWEDETIGKSQSLIHQVYFSHPKLCSDENKKQEKSRNPLFIRSTFLTDGDLCPCLPGWSQRVAIPYSSGLLFSPFPFLISRVSI